jgi:hypothetical protein
VRNVANLVVLLIALLAAATWGAAPSNASPKRIWAFESGVATHYPAPNDTGGEIVFSSTSGEQLFSYQIHDLEVSQIVSNKFGLYIHLDYNIDKFYNKSRVDFCTFNGKCSAGANSPSNIFQIAAYEDGFYAILYDGNLVKSDAGAYPLHGSIWQFGRDFNRKVCCNNADLSIRALDYNSESGLTFSGIIKDGATGERKFGLFLSKLDGIFDLAPGFRLFGIGNIPDLFPGSCDTYIYHSDKFFCIINGTIDDGSTSIAMIYELSDDWKNSNSLRSLAIPSISEDGRLFYVDLSGIYKEVNIFK